MTLRQIRALQQRHAQAREHSEVLSGIVASAIVNFSQFPPKHPVEPRDFGLGPKHVFVMQTRKEAEISVSAQSSAWRSFVSRSRGVIVKSDRSEEKYGD